MNQDRQTTGTGQNAKWNTPIGMLHSRAQDLEDYVLIGRDKQGQNVTISSGDEATAKKLLGDFQREPSFGG